MRIILVCSLLMLSACIEPVSEKVNVVTGEPGNMQVTTPQNCPDWTKMDGNGGSNFGNTPSSNYGCATVTNYGAMVDNPYDMIKGKSTNRYESAPSAVAVTQYESGGGSSASGASSSSTPSAAGASGGSQ